MNGVLAELASQYQQLYLTPGDEAQYRKIVLKGKKPEKKDLSHFKTHPFDAVTWEDTPAGRSSGCLSVRAGGFRVVSSNHGEEMPIRRNSFYTGSGYH